MKRTLDIHEKHLSIDRHEFVGSLLDWGSSNRRTFPWRKKMPLWKALLTEVMLQRTRADQVSQSFRILDSEYRVASQLSTMSVQDATRLIKPLIQTPLPRHLEG